MSVIKNFSNIANTIKGATATNPILFILVNYWQYILLFIFAVIIAFQHIQNGSLKADIALEIAKSENTRVELATCRKQTEKYKASMKELLDSSIEFRKALISINDSINKITVTTEDVIDDILSRPPPKTCEDSVTFIRNADKNILLRYKK